LLIFVMGGLQGHFAFHLRALVFKAANLSKPSRSYQVLVERTARQPHDCKRIGPGLSRPGMERMLPAKPSSPDQLRNWPAPSTSPNKN
jgi:hypothetical protein